MARKDREEKIALTEEQAKAVAEDAKKEAKKAENKKKRDALKDALDKVLAFAATDESNSLTAEIALLKSSEKVTSGISRLDKFTELFTNRSEVTGLAIYQEFNGAGKGDMRAIMRDLIKFKKPDERIWVHYDKPKDVYTVIGVGAKPPEDWTGYRPVEVDDIEII